MLRYIVDTDIDSVIQIHKKITLSSTSKHNLCLCPTVTPNFKLNAKKKRKSPGTIAARKMLVILIPDQKREKSDQRSSEIIFQ